MQQQNIKISKLKPNTGQIIGLPKNPMKSTSFALDTLRRSIIDSPEMIEWKILLVYPFEDEFVVIAGNSRLKICKELKYKELPCFVLPVETTVDKLKEYAVKDNAHTGTFSWPDLTEGWGEDLLATWGVWDKEPKQEKDEKTESVNFQASKDLVITVAFDSEAQRELLFSKLQGEGYNVWYGKRKPKN